MDTTTETEHTVEIELSKQEETALKKTGTGFGDRHSINQDVENVYNLIEFHSNPPKYYHTAYDLLCELKDELDGIMEGYVELKWKENK